MIVLSSQFLVSLKNYLKHNDVTFVRVFTKQIGVVTSREQDL